MYVTESAPVLSKRTGLLFSAVSGILTAVSYYSESLSFLIFISLTPYIYSQLRDFSMLRAFVYSMTLYMFSLFWLYNALSRVTELVLLRIIVAFMLDLVISAILSVFLNLPLLILKILLRYNKNGLQSVVLRATAFSAVYVLGEWLQGAFPPAAFPWIRLGNIASPMTAFIQSASLFGTLFISLLILLINTFSALFFYYIKSSKKYYFIIALTVLISADLIFGYTRLCRNNGHDGLSHTVLIVQGNHPRDAKSSLPTESILNDYIRLLSKEDHADLILFPETAMHSDIYNVEKYNKRLSEICRIYNSTLLFGSQYNSADRIYNACMSVTPERGAKPEYFKRILVPFGEYGIGNIRFTSENFSAGENCKSIKTEAGDFGCVICFESVFSNQTAEYVKNGAQALITLTNDSWLGKFLPLYQHHSHSIMRAVENGRYMLTSANTGISSIINENGEIVENSNCNTESLVSGKYFLNDRLTFYTRLGDIVIILPIAIIAYLLIKIIYQRFLLVIFKRT